jgi:hypothetical protein
MLALKHFYRELGNKTWGWMGFLDAFNLQKHWYATSYLAIDQGPIILMIENHRSQLLWDLFMANPEIQPMLDAIGFVYAPNSIEELQVDPALSVFPNPSTDGFQLTMNMDEVTSIELDIYSLTGVKARNILNGKALQPGRHTYEIEGNGFAPGIYLARMILNDNEMKTIKIVIQ